MLALEINLKKHVSYFKDSPTQKFIIAKSNKLGVGID